MASGETKSDIQDVGDESNDMVINTPDIENVDSIKQQKEEKARRAQVKNDEKKHIEEDALQKRKQKALKGMQYLLGISEQYSTFFKESVLKATSKVKSGKNRYQPTAEDVRNVKADVKIKNNKDDGIDVMKHLAYFKGNLRNYQVEGVTWMAVLFENGLNGILADEMGLGKTVQIIALLCYLLYKKVVGPYLIVVPLSTIPNWTNEFNRFAPNIPVVQFVGNAEERMRLRKDIIKKYPVGTEHTRPVVLTTYNMVLTEHTFLERLEWQYIIIDEGQRIKNHKSMLSTRLRNLNSANRLILSGTPLQNNITELWSLLNFLLPHIFTNVDTFANLFILDEIQDKDKLFKQEETTNMISAIHRVLAPFMLRRLKSDVLTDMVPKKEVIVYCPLSKLQRDLYEYVLTRNINMLHGKEVEEEPESLDGPRRKRMCTLNKKTYHETSDDDFSDVEEFIKKQSKVHNIKVERKTAKFLIHVTMNTMMMFKKIVDHPYLVHFPLNPDSEKQELLVNEDLVQSSGKLIVLDAMLPKLKELGHKVLLFSTLVIALDLIEEYLLMRGYKYRRLDGSHSLSDRSHNIADFNSDPDIFAFLLSTRAGGLGLNLVAADTVIFFDRDWNPQVDIQAQDRCHRIGQTKPVMVYTLVTKNTIDERVMSCANVKRRLERIVIRDGKFKTLNKDEERMNAENELLHLKKLLDQEKSENQTYVFSDEKELDKLLDRSELYKEMEKKKQT